MSASRGRVVLCGSTTFGECHEVEAAIASLCVAPEVVMLPTAAAFIHPERVLLAAANALGPLGLELEGVMAMNRDEANDPGLASRVASASTIWLTGGSALHLRTVLRESLVARALESALASGAMIVGSGAGAMALADPMVDPRGGALTIGLGIVGGATVVTEVGADPDDKEGHRLARTIELAPSDTRIYAIDTRSALVVEPDGSLATLGDGVVATYLSGVRIDGATA